MFTVELRINGTLIVHVYGHNEKDVGPNVSEYSFETYYPSGFGSKSIRGTIVHDRAEGLDALVSSILIKSKELRKSKSKRSLKNNLKKA